MTFVQSAVSASAAAAGGGGGGGAGGGEAGGGGEQQQQAATTLLRQLSCADWLTLPSSVRTGSLETEIRPTKSDQ